MILCVKEYRWPLKISLPPRGRYIKQDIDIVAEIAGEYNSRFTDKILVYFVQRVACIVVAVHET